MLSNQSFGVAAGSLSGHLGGLCNHTAAWDWVEAMQPGYMSIICAVGVVGNAFVLVVFCCHRWRRGRQQHRTVADIYLGNLAAADLLMVSCLPFWVATVGSGFHWSFGHTMCRLVNVVIGMNYYCSVLFLTLVSADRYVALTRPLRAPRGRRAAWAHGLCLAVWALGVLLSVPALLFRTVGFFPELGVDACFVDYPHAGWRMRHNLTVNLVGFIIPVPVVSFCAYHICRVLRESRALRGARGGREPSLSPTTATKKGAPAGTEAGTGAGAGSAAAAVVVERKAAYLVLVVLAMFVLCWLPYQVLIFLDSLDYYHVISGCTWAHVLDIGIQLATYLGYSNSALNPFLYVMVGKHFKQRAREACRQAACRRKWSTTAYNNNNSSRLQVTPRLHHDRQKGDRHHDHRQLESRLMS